MTDYIIEDGLPMPGRPAAKLTRALRRLEIGQSVYVTDLNRNSISSRVDCVRKASGKKFTVRKMDSDGYRIWRLT